MDLLRENLQVALAALSANKLRTALTMLGITIGVAAVVILISIGQGVEDYVLNRFNQIGSNLILVMADRNKNGVLGQLTMADVKALSDPFRVTDADGVLPQLSLLRSVSYEGRQVDLTVFGTTPDFPRIRNRTMSGGRFFGKDEYEQEARVAVLGIKAANQLGLTTFGSSEWIRIGSAKFQVIGILESSGGFSVGNDPDSLVIVPLTTAQARLSGARSLRGEYPVSNIVIQGRSADSIDSLVTQIRGTLRQERRIPYLDQDDFRLISQTDILETVTNIMTLLTIFLGLIAGISLLVGGIGIMNIMLVTVTERTREIGLRKAVGAEEGVILMQFLIEAATLSLIGGAIGILLAVTGTTLSKLLLPSLNVAVQLPSILLAVSISLAVGIFFGIYPARRAAALNPIDALRYE